MATENKQVPESDTVNRHQFRFMQSELLQKQMLLEFLLSLPVLGLVNVWLWGQAPWALLLGWSVLVIISLGWRSLSLRRDQLDSKENQAHAWKEAFAYSTYVSALAWGGLGVIAYLYGDALLLVSALVILLGITLCTYTQLQASPRTFLTFSILSLSPVLIGMLTAGSWQTIALGTTAVLFVILMMSSSKGMQKLLAHSIKLSLYNTELIQNLVTARESTSVAKRNLEKINIELQKEMEERKKVEERIRESKQRIQAIFEGMQDTIYQCDKNGVITWATPSVRRLLGYSQEEFVGMDVRKLYPDAGTHDAHINALDHGFGRLQNHELCLLHKDGSKIWVSENAIYKYNELAGIIGYEATLRDITPLKQTKEALFLAQERAYVTLGSIGDGVITTNLDGSIEYMNIVAEQGSGWTLEEAHGKPLSEVFKIVDEKTLKSVPDPLQLCLDEQKSIMIPGYLFLIHRHLNQKMSIEVNASPIRNSEKQITGVVLVFHDVTELRSLAQMTYHATHDSLTGLINRREFEKRVNQAIENARNKDSRYALCFLDLDNFKVVNDTCGHVAGDELLKQVTNRLRHELREGDTLSRIGGDEFGILFSGCSINSAIRLAENLRNIVEEFRFIWDDKSFRIGVSIGLVPITSDSGTMSEVLSAADSACYVAKENGRNRVHVYELNDDELVRRQGQVLWVQKIQDVLERNRFRLYFQLIAPIDEKLRGEEKLHGEVLLRMLDDKGDLIGPGTFIPAAERYSLMPSIDRWVIENTLNCLGEDPEQLLKRVSACSINLSGQSLSDDRFMGALIKMIDDSNVPPSILCFEITETAVISNLSNATTMIMRLREMGCRFALDDFGVGLSSFGYLKNLPVDYLKLDGCFIKNMVRDGIDHAMVQAINHVGQTMKIKTIAEFVESAEILQALGEIGVDYAQGYHIAKPVPLRDAIYTEVLSSRKDVA
jgi:diguanylate cyclase (GGDEF)-like protein/PAS domain S-box-containing protein